MNCHQINQYLIRYSEDAVSPSLRILIAEHLEQCEACQKQYQLTLLENEALGDRSDLPQLGNGFTNRVMRSVAVGYPQRKATSARQGRKTLTWVACAAVMVMIGLYWPQISNAFLQIASNPTSVNNKADITLNKDFQGGIQLPPPEIEDTQTKDIIGMMLNEQVPKSIVLQAAQPANNKQQNPYKENSPSTDTPPGVLDTADKGDPPLLNPGLIPVNMPPEYRLVEVYKGTDEHIFCYQNQDETTINISIKSKIQMSATEDPGPSISSAGSSNGGHFTWLEKNDAANTPKYCKVKIHRLKDYDIIIHGNVSSEELARLAVRIDYQMN